MKYIKSFVIICVLILACALVGCGNPAGGGGGGGGTTPPVEKTLEQVKADVMNTLIAYGDAEHGSFKTIVKNGSAENTFEMIYNYDMGKVGILSLKSLVKNANGTISVYVTDGEAYTDRYGQSKTYIELKDSDAELIANEYSFNQFNEYLVTLLNNSFFASCTLDSTDNGVAKLTLNIGAYNIDSEEESDVLTTMFDGIKEASSVGLEVTYSEDKVTNIKFNMEADEVSSIELQLLGISDSDIAIEFPDFSDYEKTK